MAFPRSSLPQLHHFIQQLGNWGSSDRRRSWSVHTVRDHTLLTSAQLSKATSSGYLLLSQLACATTAWHIIWYRSVPITNVSNSVVRSITPVCALSLFPFLQEVLILLPRPLLYNNLPQGTNSTQPSPPRASNSTQPPPSTSSTQVLARTAVADHLPSALSVCLLNTAIATISAGSISAEGNILFDEGAQHSFITKLC